MLIVCREIKEHCTNIDARKKMKLGMCADVVDGYRYIDIIRYTRKEENDN